MVREGSGSLSESITALCWRAVLTSGRTGRIQKGLKPEKRAPSLCLILKERPDIFVNPQGGVDHSSELDDERNALMMKLTERCEEHAGDPPGDRPSPPGACCCGCGGASGRWEGFGRRTPDGACGTRPAAEANTAH